jgi:hypothetical protein
MKYTFLKNKGIYILAGITGVLFILTGCSSSDDAVQVIADEFVSISGKLTSSANPAGESGVTVKGIYSDGNILNPETTTDPAGVFSLDVLKNTAVSLQTSKSSFATLNSAKEALSVNETGLDIELVTSSDAESAIANVFSGPILAGFAWLVVDVIDSSDVQVNGVTISTTGSPIDTAATACDGTDSGGNVTIAPPCVPSRDGPMYFAYFDIDSTEVTVTAGASSQLAPVRRGEVTFLEFEMAAPPVGTIVAGQAKYDADCGSCHAAGTYDDTTSNGASDLFGKSSMLIADISSYSPVKKAAVADLTPQEILDLTAFLDSL